METAVTIKTGETYSLVLKGLGSAGYAWTFDVTGDKEAVAVSFAAPASASESGPTNQPPAGGSVNHELLLKGVAPGSAVVRAVLRRPWEKDKPPAEERILQVTVE
jgi:predicted secreted protein